VLNTSLKNERGNGDSGNRSRESELRGQKLSVEGGKKEPLACTKNLVWGAGLNSNGKAWLGKKKKKGFRKTKLKKQRLCNAACWGGGVAYKMRAGLDGWRC